MIALPVPIPEDDLRAEVSPIELEPIADGSGQARGPGTTDGWIKGLSMARIDRDGEIVHFPLLTLAIAHLEAWRSGRAAQIMVNRLDARGFLGQHRDGPPHDRERWHLPIITAPEVSWWDEDNGEVRMSAGAWWGPCPYWRLHAITNLSLSARLHVVCDLLIGEQGTG